MNRLDSFEFTKESCFYETFFSKNEKTKSYGFKKVNDTHIEIGGLERTK